MVAVEKDNGEIILINLEEGTIEKTISIYKDDENEYTYNYISFFSGDNYLLKACATKGNLDVIDIKTGEVLAETKDKFMGDDIIVDDNTEYFGIKNNSVGRDSDEYMKQAIDIYTLDQQNQALVKCTSIDYGWVSFEGKEVVGGINKSYYTDFYDFSQLRKEAEKLLKGEKLTKKDRRKYFLEN